MQCYPLLRRDMWKSSMSSQRYPLCCLAFLQHLEQTGHTLERRPASLNEVLEKGKCGEHIETEESLKNSNIADFKNVPSKPQS